MSDSLGPQFTSYRGLLLGHGEAPDTDEGVLEHLRTPYGEHWTSDRRVATRFANSPNAGGYETIPSQQRQFTKDANHWGVVLEAQHGPNVHERRAGQRFDNSLPGSRGERERRVDPDTLQSVRAHVVQSYDLMNRPEHVTHKQAYKSIKQPVVRSFEIPAEHWRSGR